MNAVISKFFECITCRIIAVARNKKCEKKSWEILQHCKKKLLLWQSLSEQKKIFPFTAYCEFKEIIACR